MIALRCACGKKLQGPDQMAGRTGKCPACGESVPVPRAGFVDEDGETVASDNSALELGEDPGQPKSRPPAPAAAAASAAAARLAVGAPISCPRCKTTYGPGAIFCPRCAIDLQTGKPLAGVVPGHMSAPRPVRAEWPAWLVISAFLRRPVIRLLLAALFILAAVLAVRHFMAKP